MSQWRKIRLLRAARDADEMRRRIQGLKSRASQREELVQARCADDSAKAVQLMGDLRISDKRVKGLIAEVNELSCSSTDVGNLRSELAAAHRKLAQSDAKEREVVTAKDKLQFKLEADKSRLYQELVEHREKVGVAEQKYEVYHEQMEKKLKKAGSELSEHRSSLVANREKTREVAEHAMELMKEVETFAEREQRHLKEIHEMEDEREQAQAVCQDQQNRLRRMEDRLRKALEVSLAPVTTLTQAGVEWTFFKRVCHQL